MDLGRSASPTFPAHARRAGVEASPGTTVLWDAGYTTQIPDLPFLPAAVLLTLAVALAFFLTRPPAELRLGRRLQLTLDPGLEIDPALSPDGELVAYAAGPLGETRLYVRQVEGGTPVALTRVFPGL